MMMNEEKTTGWCIETTDCFWWLYQFSIFSVVAVLNLMY